MPSPVEAWLAGALCCYPKGFIPSMDTPHDQPPEWARCHVRAEVPQAKVYNHCKKHGYKRCEEMARANGPRKPLLHGHQSGQCNECVQDWNTTRGLAYTRESVARNRAKNRAYWADHDPFLEHPTGVKECRRKHGLLPLSAFWRDSNQTDGLRQLCRECDNATGETRDDRNAWRELARTRPPCAYCGDPSEHIDHVVPVSKGGRDVKTNYLPSCSADNLSKRDKYVYDWLLGAENRPDEDKPVHYRTWDAPFIKELFAEIERGTDVCP